ncbi:PREDICTED: uncharacterized protein LOC104773234 [Camelina sativa]|uniref:Uncharacterized protein LOC104773234 n=1 Tax=Camelina sativa TaxID=90675 RepID=A0ABM0Y636_CAMSA|nr:PREDICTED: uncharacterized protein LOC104773234 [Camelina sativa]
MANSVSDSAQQPDQYNNPYFLHGTDHAGLILVSDRLTTGADFNSWRRSMRMALNVRNKLGFIVGTISKPSSDHRDYGSWSRCNNMVSTWFKQDDAPRVYEIEQKLSSIHQGAMDVTAYYTELVTLWEELKNYVELPVCTCGKCECIAALLWEKLQQRRRVTKFLMGLNDSYEATRRHILMIKPMPSIENAFHMVTEDERQRNIAKPTRTDGVVFQTSGPPTYDGPADNMAYSVQNTYRPRQSCPLCTHCGISGHVVQKCFKLHGYPPGYIPGFKSISSGCHSQRMVNPQSVQQKGHSQSIASPHQPRAHAVANITSSSPYVPPPALNAINLDVSKMTSDQMQTLIQQLSTHMQLPENQAPSKVSSISEHGAMAIQSSDDSGATTHVCSDLALFRETIPVSGVTSVQQKGHSQSIASPHQPRAHAVANITSSSPYVPPPALNAINLDVSKMTSDQMQTLIQQLSTHMQLPENQAPSKVSSISEHGAMAIQSSDDSGATTHVCSDLALFRETIPVSGVTEFIQGLMIGKGILLHNLYILQLDSPAPHTSSSLASSSSHFFGSLTVDGDLWHTRLGHPSSDKLQHIPGIVSKSKKNSSPCHVCHLAKQKKIVF